MADKALREQYGGNIQLNIKATMSSSLKGLAGVGPDAIAQTLLKVGERALKRAKENVTEGHGPSPHTFDADIWGHLNPHEDTGFLRRNVKLGSTIQSGFRFGLTLFTDVAYGVYLELGWRAGGKFYRYPWMGPAWNQALSELESQLKLSFNTSIKDFQNKKTYGAKDIQNFMKDNTPESVKAEFERAVRRASAKLSQAGQGVE